MLILIDSGSSHSFVSDVVARNLHGATRTASPLKVRVANGGIMLCDWEFPACEWLTHGESFISNLKVLPLGSYDVILGMDWLACFSPMQVDWALKWM